MAAHSFKPYQNEADCLQIGDLNIENRLDRISLSGSLDITRDKLGLTAARKLRDLLVAIVSELESGDLPERIATIEPETVKNPFA